LTNMIKQHDKTEQKSISLIQVTKCKFSTMASSKKMSSNDRDNDRQPEIGIWPPKPEILISLELQYDRQHRNSNGKAGVL